VRRVPLAVAWFEPISDTADMAKGILQNEIRRRVQASSGLSPEERILAGIKQSELAIRVVEAGLRDQYPDADEATIASLLLERVRLMKNIQNRRIAKT
jgi:hypothetical protein